MAYFPSISKARKRLVRSFLIALGVLVVVPAIFCAYFAFFVVIGVTTPDWVPKFDRSTGVETIWTPIAVPHEGRREILDDHDAGPDSGDCRIKGNISWDSGARIYHLPGDEYYEQTSIVPSEGERWFCSEDEARAAGWRRTRR